MKLLFVVALTSLLFGQSRIFWGEEGAEVIPGTFGHILGPVVCMSSGFSGQISRVVKV